MAINPISINRTIPIQTTVNLVYFFLGLLAFVELGVFIYKMGKFIQQMRTFISLSIFFSIFNQFFSSKYAISPFDTVRLGKLYEPQVLVRGILQR